jgi:hypothetical protein
MQQPPIEVEIGDYVEVIDDGYLYSWWEELAAEWKLNNWATEKSVTVTKGTKGVVIRKRPRVIPPRCLNDNEIVLGVLTSKFDFIISSNGVKIIDPINKENIIMNQKFDIKNLMV